VPVPRGSEGAARLLPALAAAIDGTGPAVAPVPTVSATVTNDYVMSILRGLHLDDGLALEFDEVAAVISTSGSTGDPKGVLLSAGNLTALTEQVNGPRASPQWILALPVTSMGGINVLVRAIGADREPIVVDSIGGAGPFTPQAFAHAVAIASQSSADLCTAVVPPQLARLLSDEEGIEALTACRQVLVGGGPLRPSVRSMAHDLRISIVSTYGATETAGGCIFDDHPLDGVRVSVDPDAGTLVIGGPTVALGYRGDPSLTSEAFGSSGFRTNDVGRVNDDGTVIVIGRADDVVVVNGVNVALGAVEQILGDHPDLETAAVVAVSTDHEPRLHAFVVVRDDAPAALEAAQESVLAALGRPARPVMHAVDRLPRLPHGKVDRRQLTQWARREEEGR